MSSKASTQHGQCRQGHSATKTWQVWEGQPGKRGGCHEGRENTWLPPEWPPCPRRGRTHGSQPSSAPVTAGTRDKAARCASAMQSVQYLPAPGTLQGEREAGWGRRDLASLTHLVFAKHWWKWARAEKDKSGAGGCRLNQPHHSL